MTEKEKLEITEDDFTWYLLKNASCYKKWKKKHPFVFATKPKEFPCFVSYIFDSTEEQVTLYLYKKTIEKMLNQLSRKE